ncbi:MAG: LysR family transcriptional regulator [Nannocystaceae bacterium]
MNFSQIDLNLLKVLHALLRLRSGTQAARELHVTQSAVSNALGRLRQLTGDPLFVRSGRGLVPTPRALELAPELDAAFVHLRAALGGAQAFDPGSSARAFTVACTDAIGVALLPTLHPLFERRLPRASLRLVSLDDLIASAGLISGEVDVHVGLRPADGAQPGALLYEDPLAVVARRGHPRARNGATPAQLSALQWIEVLTIMGRPGAGRTIVDQALARHGVTRMIGLSVPNFTMAALAAVRSDQVACMPRRLAEILARDLPLRLIDLPFLTLRLPISMSWHPRADADPGQRYFRGLLVEAAQRRRRAR